MHKIHPLVRIEGDQTGPRVVCRDCGELDLFIPDSVAHAGLVQRRHLAEHLSALADEITQAAR